MANLKKIWNVVSTAFVVLIVLLAVFLMGSRLLGFQVYNVLSNSMMPVYSKGDLIYVKEVDPKDVEIGDVITFVVNEDKDIATHRVIAIDAEHQHFYTKGDANKDADQNPVHFKNVIGQPKFSIRFLGTVSDFIQNPPGLYITVGVGVVLIAAVFLPDMFVKDKKREDEEKSEDKDGDDEKTDDSQEKSEEAETVSDAEESTETDGSEDK